MAIDKRADHDPSRGITRRDSLSLGLGAIVAATTTAIAVHAADDFDAIRARGTKVGLPEFREENSEHFRSIGDASEAYQREALAAAESIASEFVAHFNEKGWKLRLPEQRMTVVVLASAASFAAFSGEPLESVVGGQYDVDAARLVIFDYRGGGRAISAQAELINSRTLAHETTHQISYATGLVSARSDVPLAINEGLGTYGEVWRPKGRGRIGQVNRPWLARLRQSESQKRRISLDRLIADDKAFEDQSTATLAYAQSWLLAHYLLKSKPATPRFRTYLARLVESRPEPNTNRIALFESIFGDLDRLEQELVRYEKRPIGT
ncbi:MAG: DUF1570 domain-containing protein [Isosphaeraceae bacterium]|nr:DUF1570 domain-containing protein [Isosphaeraceae bacterium]